MCYEPKILMKKKTTFWGQNITISNIKGDV